MFIFGGYRGERYWVNANNGRPSTCYFDILIAEDPVPVAQAPSVYVEATSDAGRCGMANVTNLQYEVHATRYARCLGMGTCRDSGCWGSARGDAHQTPATIVETVVDAYIDGVLIRRVGRNYIGGSIIYYVPFFDLKSRAVEPVRPTQLYKKYGS